MTEIKSSAEFLFDKLGKNFKEFVFVLENKYRMALET